MGSEVVKEKEAIVSEIHFLPCLPQEQSTFHNMQYNHLLDPDRRKHFLENIPGMYNMSCTQLLALANTAGSISSSVPNQVADSHISIDSLVNSSNMEANTRISNHATSLVVNTGITSEETLENTQCDVSTPKKFCYDLNLTPEEIISTSPRLTEPELYPITLDTPGKRSLPDQESIKKSLPETESPTREKETKREREEKLHLKTPRQIQKRKKIRPKVVREGSTKKSVTKSSVKKASATTATATASTTNISEETSYIRPKRSTRRSIRFDYDLEEENNYCGLTFTSEGRIGVSVNGKIVSNPTMRIFDNVPKRRRRSRAKSSESKDFLCSTLSLFNAEPEEYLSSDSHISENNHKKFGRKRSSRVTRPRNFRSLKRVLDGLVPIKRARQGYVAPQLKAIVTKMHPHVSLKKRSNRDPIASKLNAKVLHLQWRRQKSTGTSQEEVLEQIFSINSITKLFKELDINRESLCLPQNRETAIILHQNTIQEQKLAVQDGSLVSYSHGKKHLPKVNLDDETNRVWKLLMVSIESEGVDGLDDDKQKWWKDERELFHDRANSFIARMRLVQGDRRFSPWKGSVVDSVVGVFLTQNVADHSSSSAFMDIAAEFPIDFNTNKGLCHEECGSSVTHDEIVMNMDSGNALAASRVPNSTCIIIHEIDDDDDDEEDVDVACSQVTSTNQSKAMLLDTTTNNLVTHFGSEVKETICCDEEEQTCFVENAKEKSKKKPNKSFDWDSLRKEAENRGEERKRDESTMDIVDWDTLRCTDVDKIAAIIRKRGMNNMLSKRIKAFLNRVVQDHGSINLEWLRDVPPDKAKEYLLSINGLGLKSVECVRLLSLHQIAFPVDTNVGRIAVRLGWVPLQPLPDELQMHLLELYPVLESVQKYLWPRLCKLDQKTLYELHYHMITFGKVFCTKVKPNCNACPMKAECRHYASARASARLALPEPEDKTIIVSHETKYNTKPVLVNFRPSLLLTQDKISQNCEPIIEEPASPEPECVLPDIEDYPWDKTSIIIEGDNSNDDPWENKDVIPTIMLHKEAGTSKDLVVLSTQASYIPTHKLKTTDKLRTEHHVYELPDSHPILEGFEKRESDDKFPYLLAIWTPGETVNSIQPPERRCLSQESNTLCHEETCFSCNSTREEMSQIVRGTILIPCRTAMRGGFPLNGTYFQTNEVFADHGSSVNPIDVPRLWIWNLPRRIAYFGSSVSAIFGGLSVEAIQYGFWRGYVCVRGFDRKTRRPQTLVKRLHCPPSKQKQEDDQ
ncbi:unnamed protein product [Cochlearia groenlandica]